MGSPCSGGALLQPSFRFNVEFSVRFRSKIVEPYMEPKNGRVSDLRGVFVFSGLFNIFIVFLGVSIIPKWLILTSGHIAIFF